MSSTIDEKVVELKFDNKQFESGVKESLSTLDRLKEAVTKNISSKSLENVSKAAKDIDVSNAVKGIEALQDRFSTLGIVGMRVIENITDGLMNGLSRGIHTVTDSIVSGGIKRAMNIENAHFQLQGLIDDEKEVQAIMEQANKSVDGTAYSYDVAAKAASMFAASGIKSGQQMENALSGIAGVAATANADYERVSELFTTIAGKGRIQAMELNRFAAMGMNAAAAITNYMNNVNSGAVEASENITAYVKELTNGAEITEAELRDMTQKGAISFDLFSEAMATSFGKHAQDANKTFTGSMANIRAALARTGAMFVSPLIQQDGPFVQFFNAVRIKVNEFNKALGAANGMAGKFTSWVNSLVTRMTEVVSNFKVANVYVKKFGDGTTKVFESATMSVQKWGDGTEQVVQRELYTPFHAFQSLVYSVVNIFKAIGSVIKPIAEAFRETFTFDSSGIYSGIETFRKFTASLKLSEENSQNLKDAFKGLFDVVKLGIDLFIRLLGTFRPLNRETTSLSDGFFELIGNLGRTLTEITEMVRESKLLATVFDFIRAAFVNISLGMESFMSTIGSGILDRFKNIIQNLASPLDTFKNIISHIGNIGMAVFGGLLAAINGIKAAFTPIVNTVKPFFKLVMDSLKETIERVGPIKAFFQLLNGTLLTGIMFKVNTILKKFQKTAGKPQGINKVFSALSKDLNEFTKLIDAKALKEIAISIGILVGAMYGLAALDPDKLALSLVAISTMLAEMIGALKALTEMTSSSFKLSDAFSGILDAVRLNALAGTLIKMAAAILVLSIAIKSLGSMDLEDIIKGLGAITFLVGEMVAVTLVMDRLNAPDTMKTAGFGMILMAAAIAILSKSVKSLGSLDLKSIVQGLLSVGLLLAGLLAFTKIAGGATQLDTIGLGMILVAAGVAILAQSIKSLAGLNMEQIGQGLAAIGGIILELALFTLITDGSDVLKTSVAMVALAGAIKIIGDAIKQISGISFEAIGNALAAITIALVELIASVYILSKIDPKKLIGSVIAMASLVYVIKNPLADTLERLSQMSWESIGKAMVAMGGALLELIVAMKFLKDIGRWGTAGGIAALAALVKVLENPLANTLQKLAVLGWSGMLVAIIAMGAALAELVGVMFIFTKFNAEMLIKALAGVVLLDLASLSLLAIGHTMHQIGSMGWEGVIPGLVGMAGAMIILVAAMYAAGAGLMTGIPIAGAILLDVASLSLLPIASTMQKLGGMSWTEIGHAMAAMGGALLVLIAAMYLAGIFAPMSIPGAIAVAIVAQAVPPLAAGLAKIGGMDFASIGEACKNLAKTLLLLIVASVLMKIIGGIDWELIKTAFSKMVQALVIVGVVSTLISGISNTDWPAVYAGMKDLIKTLLLLVAASDVMAVIGTGGIVGATLLNTFGQMFLKAITALVAAIDIIKTVDAGDIGPQLKTIGEAIVVLGLSLKAFGPLSFIGANAMVKLADAIATLVPALTVLSDPKTDPKKIGDGMKMLGESFAAFGKSMKSFNLFAGVGANAMNILADAIAKMAPALMIMTRLDQGKMVNSLSALGHAFQVFGEALDATPFWGSGMRANGIGALIDNIGKLTEVLPPFMALDASRASTALTTLGAAFKNFGTALNDTPFWGSKTRAEGIGALIDNISTLTEALPGFMALDVGSVNTAFRTLSTGFTDFGMALNAAPYWGVADRGTAIQTLVNSISTLTFGLKNFQNANLVDVESTLTTIAGAFATFGTTLEEAPLFNSAERATGIATLVDAISGLADGLKKMLELETDTETISNILDSIGTAFKDFGKAISNAPLFKPDDRGMAITNLVDSIDKLVPAIASFKDLGTGNVSRILNAVGEGLKKMGESIKDTPLFNSEGRANALISLATGLDTLANVMVRLNNNLNVGQISTMFSTLAGTVRQFGNALTAFGSDSAMNAQTFVSMVEAVASLATVDSEALSATMTSLKDLITLLTNMATTNTEGLANFSETLITIANEGLKGFASAFKTNSANAVETVRGFVTQVYTVIKSKEDDINTAGIEAATKYLNGISSKYAMALAVGRRLGTIVIEALKALYTTFRSVGAESANQYGQGILSTTSKVADMAKQLAFAAYSAMNPVDENGASLFYKAGKNAGEGYVKGIESQLSAVKAAAAEMASAAGGATAKEQESRSPAKKFIKLGSYAGEGYVIGILRWAQNAFDAGKELAKASNAAIDESEFSEPVIRPMVDLTNVVSAADTISSLFAAAMTTTMNNTSVAGSGVNARVGNVVGEEFQNGEGSTGNTYNFNQYNNSPKALSRIEIYRDTKNLMKQYREAVESV